MGHPFQKVTIYYWFVAIHNSFLDMKYFNHFAASQNIAGYPKLFLDIHNSNIGYSNIKLRILINRFLNIQHNFVVLLFFVIPDQ